MQSDIVLEGLAGTAMRPTAEGPLLVKCIDPKTQAVVFKVDPHALYVPDCKVQVFSSCKMAEYGHGIVQNYQRVIGNHVILDCNTQEILNLRVNGAVLSNKTMNYDRSTVKLPQHILQCLHVTLPLCKMIGIPKGEANKLSKEMAPTQVSVNPLNALVHFRGTEQIASQTSVTEFQKM